MADYAKIFEELQGIAVEDNPALVKQKSRDFYWYSPILKEELDNVVGDLVVSPTTEEEVIRTLKVAFDHGVPVTPRGGGTGNYGQAMPLSGGIVLNLINMNKVKEILPGRVICEPGIIISELDRQTKEHSGQELRFHPSTKQTASVAGFIAGGSGGVGSITWGGLRDLGNILRLRVVTMEAEPRVLELSAWDLQKVSHAYGTNGIITEVEMPLAPAYDWVDVIVGHDDFMDAVKFADTLAHKNGILLKEVAPIAAPIPYDYFTRHKPWLKEGQSVVVLMVAPHSMEAFLALADKMKGDVRFRSDTVESMKGIPHELFPDEVIGHLEFIKFDGHIQCAGLPLVRYTTKERLEEIIRIHEENGCPIFNPHRYTLEEGGMKQTDQVQLAFKKETDPKGLLNPGKMIAWENPDFDFSAGKNYLFPGLEVFSEAT